MNWFRTIFLLISCIVMSVTYSLADEQHTKERRDKNHHNQEYDENGDKRLPSAQNQTYLNFCGSCHFAYQPGLLPRASWEKMMSEGHFGTLDEQTREQIMDYLKTNSAENNTSEKISKKILASVGTNKPSKITDIPYIRKKHDEISPDVFKRKTIGSCSNCIACHTKAKEGNYEDDFVKIPN
jgi:cytochrome c553